MSPEALRLRARPPALTAPVFDALGEIERRRLMTPADASSRARELLTERLDEVDERPRTAFVRGVTGLLSEHTRFFDGFALFLHSQAGVAVAARTASEGGGRVIFDGGLRQGGWPLGNRHEEDAPLWVRLVDALLERLAPRTPLHIAVVASVAPACLEGYLGALALALARALPQACADDAVLAAAEAAMEGVLGRPPLRTALLAAHTLEAPGISLVDAATREVMPLELPSAGTVGWGLVEVPAPPQPLRLYDEADEALALLQDGPFPRLPSFREVEHCDLQRVLTALPERLRPPVRFLVGENRRVQRAVVALRRGDWQLLGAVLLMAHASLRDDLCCTDAGSDALVAQVEGATTEGLFGARQLAGEAAVLVAGQPFCLPAHLRRLQEGGSTRLL